MASKYAGMTANQMKRAIEAEQAAFEAITRSDGFLIADLRIAFDRVCDRENWKNPVNTILGNDLLKRWEAEEGISLDMIEEAITFFQGSVAKVNHNVSFAHITSPGYVC